ncbi:hypothetical protein GCM10007291_21030 [Gemmobacter nanjingensis]|jgi:hypothetical protein|uniref:Lipoprotein n=1 Tax=Gemmobacter nanjingensis TaxID=488454 RepID=A0ABQ3FFR2_9RHOB|nr:hypothetical protein [Gemmobacter nanjingensis]GHC21683.1 hypothetical protein GCM10007291_21030 [Gemmobacter nanjingensis]
MKRLLILLPLLAACGTPQEQCIRQVTRDQRVVERLITETEENLRRGYAIETYVTTVTRWRPCGPGGVDEKGKPAPPQMCLDDIDVTRTRPKAIDLDAEAVKLRQLRTKRDALVRQSSSSVAACKAQYPE